MRHNMVRYIIADTEAVCGVNGDRALETIVDTVGAHVTVGHITKQMEVHAVATDYERLPAITPLCVLSTHRCTHGRDAMHAELGTSAAVIALQYDVTGEQTYFETYPCVREAVLR
jgi:hypothetical protein